MSDDTYEHCKTLTVVPTDSIFHDVFRLET